jgi:hypothetical protein
MLLYDFPGYHHATYAHATITAATPQQILQLIISYFE